MSHISNMNAYLTIAIFQQTEGNGILTILCIRRVNCKCGNLPKVPPLFDLFTPHAAIDWLRFVYSFVGIRSRKPEIRRSEARRVGQDCVSLCRSRGSR